MNPVFSNISFYEKNVKFVIKKKKIVTIHTGNYKTSLNKHLYLTNEDCEATTNTEERKITYAKCFTKFFVWSITVHSSVLSV